MRRVKGWEGIGGNRGKFFCAEDGFDYAAKACGILGFDHTAPDAEEFKKMVVEWFFSGEWVEIKHMQGIAEELDRGAVGL